MSMNINEVSQYTLVCHSMSLSFTQTDITWQRPWCRWRKLGAVENMGPSIYYVLRFYMSNKCNQCDYASSDTSNLRTHLNTHIALKKIQTSVANVILLLLWRTFWGDIWKSTVKKSQTNATNATLLLLGQEIWRTIWECIVEKSQTDVTNVITHHHMQEVWGDVWKGEIVQMGGNHDFPG